ncbi:3870_t:CDS:2, partial [Racocetra fulgida]
MNTLQSFLRVEPLNQITISRVLHKYWKDCGVNTEEADCEHVIKILKELTDGDIDETTCNIGSMKEILRHLRNESQTHFHLFEMLCDADVDKLLCNDPLVNKEHGARFTNLKQKDKEKTNLIAKLEQNDKEKMDLIAKLKYDVSLIKGQDKSMVCNQIVTNVSQDIEPGISDLYLVNSNDVSEDINLLCNDIDITNNASNSDEHQEETSSRVSNLSSTALAICVKPKSLAGKEIDNFLIEKHNCNEIREKKLQHRPPTESFPKEDTYIFNIKSSIPPEQKKEQGLIQEISTSIKDQNDITRISQNNVQFTDNSSDDLLETEINEEAKRISSETEVSITTTPSILLSHTYNSEVMINEDVKSLPETEVSISAKSISKEPETVNVFDKYNENDGEFSDDNDDEFSDDNDDGDYCSFSDEDEPGYYYDL